MKSKTTKKIIDFLTKKRVTDIENSAEKNGRKFYNEVPFNIYKNDTKGKNRTIRKAIYRAS